MIEKKKPGGMPQKKIEELTDDQLDQVTGGLEIPKFSGNGNLSALKLGQALEKPSCFSKSDDHMP